MIDNLRKKYIDMGAPSAWAGINAATKTTSIDYAYKFTSTPKINSRQSKDIAVKHTITSGVAG